MSDTRVRSAADGFTRKFLAQQRLLVVAPHADDETAGAGGLMARVQEAGGKVFVMVMSTGDLLHFDDTGRKTKKKTRREELAAALLDSLEPPPGISIEDREEIERRAEEARRGEPGIPWAEVKRNAEKK